MERTGKDASAIICKEMNINEDPLDFLKRRDEFLKPRFPKAELCDGAVELVKEAKFTRKIPIAVATSSNRGNFDAKSKNKENFYSLFDSIICGDEVENGKPNPELFLKSMKKLGINDPKNVLVFEDAPFGVKAANNANMPVVQILDPNLPEGSNEKAGAIPTVLLKNLKEFSFDLFDWKK